MKEATGATILMGLAAMILLIFIIMVAFFIGYGKAFRLKNKIINRIEQGEGINIDDLIIQMRSERNAYSGNEARICYSKVNDSAGDFYGFTMSVIVYMHTEERILKVKIPISGETRIIQTGSYYENIRRGDTNPFGDPSIPLCTSDSSGWLKVTL